MLQVTAAACGVNNNNNNNNNKSRPVNPSSTPADVSTMTEIGGDYHPGYSVHAGSGNWRGTARSQVSLISARLGLGGGGGGGGHGAARSQVFPDLGSARQRRRRCGLRGTARSQVRAKAIFEFFIAS